MNRLLIDTALVAGVTLAIVASCSMQNKEISERMQSIDKQKESQIEQIERRADQLKSSINQQGADAQKVLDMEKQRPDADKRMIAEQQKVVQNREALMKENVDMQAEACKKQVDWNAQSVKEQIDEYAAAQKLNK